MAKRTVFVSYSRKDEAVAQRVLADLATYEVDVWRDQESLRAGEHWPERLAEAIAGSDGLLLLWSEAAAKSDSVRSEWNNALALGKPVLPLMLDRTELEPALAARHALHLQDLHRLPEALGTSRSNASVARQRTASRLGVVLIAAVIATVAVAGAMFFLWPSDLVEPTEIDPCEVIAADLHVAIRQAQAKGAPSIASEIAQIAGSWQQACESPSADDLELASLKDRATRASALVVPQETEPMLRVDEFDFSVETWTADRVREVEDGGYMYSDDHFSINVSLPKLAYLYVVLRSEDGRAKTLYPLSTDPNPVSGQFVIPAEGGFKLDHALGAEKIEFYFERRPNEFIEKHIPSVEDPEPQRSPEAMAVFEDLERLRSATLDSTAQKPKNRRFVADPSGAIATFEFDHR